MLKGIRRRLLQWQERQGYQSQADFAQRSGIAASTLKGWMGKKPKAPDLATLFTFADNQGLSIDWILYGSGPELRDLTRPIGDLELELHALCARACATGELAGFTREIATRLLSPRELLGELVKLARESLDRDLTARSRAMRETALEYLRNKSAQLTADPLKDVPLFIFKGVVKSVLSQKDFPITTGLLNDEYYDDDRARELISEGLPDVAERMERDLTAAFSNLARDIARSREDAARDAGE